MRGHGEDIMVFNRYMDRSNIGNIRNVAELASCVESGYDHMKNPMRIQIIVQEAEWLHGRTGVPFSTPNAKRDLLVKELIEKSKYSMVGTEGAMCLGLIEIGRCADFIIADRKKMLDEIERPLRNHRNKYEKSPDWLCVEGDAAIDEALQAIKTIRG